ncbi:hypothetical protein E5C26_20370 [Serratia proteamaculans]|uniref:hypothetical protein n=1 Tax=Serratia proteamaculans TaxID=28151 RepID=UPI001075E8E2|nr:hypothetical protein [Serratia proteamaculans]TFZ48696.1 hypothetical protein E5C26_20370 [Serratia proteamaculans]
MTFETLITELLEQLDADDTHIYLEKDHELVMEFQDGLIVTISHEINGDMEIMEINAELGDIPKDTQCLIALLMANKYQPEDNKAVFSINAASEKVNCTVTLSVEDSHASAVLEQLKRLISYQEWFCSFAVM